MKLLSHDVNRDNHIKSLEVYFKELLAGIVYNLSDLDLILSKVHLVTLKKGDYFCKAGKYCRNIGFLMQGLLLSYFENSEGEIEVSRFFDVPINIVITDFDAFINELPCSETIKAIEDSTVFYMNKQDLYTLYKNAPTMNIVGRKLAEYGYIMAVRRIQALQSLNTEQRFKKLYSINPSLFYRLSKKDLASFLKMNRNLITKYLKRI